MPIKIEYPEYGISYEETGPHHLYLAIARLDEDGKGDIMVIVAKDEFTAGVAAKSMCKKVLKLETLEHMLLRLQDVLQEADE